MSYAEFLEVIMIVSFDAGWRLIKMLVICAPVNTKNSAESLDLMLKS